MGSLIDIVVVALLLFGAVSGYRRGLLYQALQLAMGVVAFLAAKVWHPSAAAELEGILGLSHEASTVVAFAGIFVVLYLAGGFVLWRLTRGFRKSSDALSATDGWLGVPVGMARTGLWAYVALVTLIMAHRMTGETPVPYAQSHSGQLVAKYNVLDQVPEARAFVKLGWIVTHYDTLELIADPHFRAILAHDKAAFLRSPEVASALLEQDWATVVSQAELWDLLAEPDVQAHLDAIPWRKEERTAVNGPHEQAPPRAPGSPPPVATP